MLSLPPENRPFRGSDSEDPPPPPPQGTAVLVAIAAICVGLGFAAGWFGRPAQSEPSAVAGKLEPALGKSPTAAAPQKAAALEDALNQPALYRQQMALAREVANLRQPAVLAAISQEEARWPIRGAVLAVLFSRYAEFDPQAAALRAAQLFDNVRRYDGMEVMAAALRPWLARDREAAEAWRESLPRGPIRDRVSFSLIDQLIDTDPQQALRLTLSEVNAPVLISRIFTRLAAQDAPSAADMATDLPRWGLLGTALNSVLTVWAERDPAAAYAWLRQASRVPKAIRLAAADAFYSAWSASDPAAAAAFLLAHAADTDLAPAQRSGASREETIAANWALKDRQAALLWASQLPPRSKEDALKGILVAWGSADARNAVAYAAALPPSEGDGEALLTPTLDAWVRSDLNAARDWVRNLPLGKLRALAAKRLAAGWFEQDPQAALEFAFAEGDALAPETGFLVRSWAEFNADKATRWVQSLPPSPERDHAMAGILGPLFDADQARALSLFDQVSTNDRAAAARDLLQRWTILDSAAAATWVKALPPGKVRNAAVYTLAEHWGSTGDAKAACDWLGTQPATAARDDAVGALVHSLVLEGHGDTTLAIPLAEAIADPAACNLTLERIAESWFKKDAANATKWIAQSPDFTPEQRAKLTASAP